MATARWLVGRQVLLRLRGYISVWLALQVSLSDVVGVGLGGVAKRVVPSHTPRSYPSETCILGENLTDPPHLSNGGRFTTRVNAQREKCPYGLPHLTPHRR